MTELPDDTLLKWVGARAAGEPTRRIAKRLKVASNSVVQATNAVMDADIEESGEPEAAVKPAYWTRRRTRR